MGVWWTFFICNIILPLIFILCGWYLKKYYPKKINSAVGYRTKRAMKNEDTWKFANEYCGKLWIKIGLIMIPITILIQIPYYKSTEDVLSTLCIVINTIQIIVLLCSLIPVENALKKTFDENGNRK